MIPLIFQYKKIKIVFINNYLNNKINKVLKIFPIIIFQKKDNKDNKNLYIKMNRIMIL